MKKDNLFFKLDIDLIKNPPEDYYLNENEKTFIYVLKHAPTQIIKLKVYELEELITEIEPEIEIKGELYKLIYRIPEDL